MNHPGNVLAAAIEAMTEDSSKARRRLHAATALAALRQMRDAVPPADAVEAERRGYVRGLLVAIALLQEARQEHEKPLATASVGTAYTVINGVINYGQFMVSDAESRFMREASAMGRLKKEEQRVPPKDNAP